MPSVTARSGELGEGSAVLLVLGGVHPRVVRDDDDEAAVGAGDGAPHKDKVIFGIDLDDVEIADRALGIAVLTCRLVALLGSAATAVAGIGRDAAVLS